MITLKNTKGFTYPHQKFWTWLLIAWTTTPILLCFLLLGKGQQAQVLALHLTPFQQTVAKADSAVTHSNSMSSMHDQIPPKQLSWAESRPRVRGISHIAGRIVERVGVLRRSQNMVSWLDFIWNIHLSWYHILTTGKSQSYQKLIIHFWKILQAFNSIFFCMSNAIMLCKLASEDRDSF